MDNYREQLASRDVLQALRDDIRRDLSAIESYFVPQLQQQAESRRRLEKFVKGSVPISEAFEFVNDVRLISTYYTFNPNRVGLEELSNTAA